ncbi:hypothetical protein INR77_13680 [Erythrobacter sp. SCSIO 43205]|uniref:hypothetical protein n=1 Tax=Erythrobacter sp. SCSIO 43205 TaxID=2779361 RepID=UPI001CA88F46|nr:hypothetical protein [Erythrobacter sp. SCSIO 43205]UAB77812.1 hypothetical protein INR77_13680 [Erythrobacter sp. SCSIO 43205]
MLDRLKSINPLFIFTVILPTLISILYFGVLANDVYISESRFVVRNPSQKSVSPIAAALGQAGLGGGGGGAEGNGTVTEYIRSRRALAEANEDGFIVEAYTGSDIFFFDRFGTLWGESQEQLFEYFLGKVGIAEGLSGQVMTLRVSAFDPSEAQEINSRLLMQSEDLVNSLSERSRDDTIALAKQQVEEATDNARSARIELAQFRGAEQIVDPTQESLVGLQMVGKLQDQLISAKTQLRQLQTYTPNASQIPFLRTQVRQLESEIEQTRKDLTSGQGSLSASMVRYQELAANSEFAEQQLAIALASLQEAQAEARRKSTYIERISDPSLPDFAAEPRRIRSIFATFVLGLLTWGVLSMLMIGVREHRD